MLTPELLDWLVKAGLSAGVLAIVVIVGWGVVLYSRRQEAADTTLNRKHELISADETKFRESLMKMVADQDVAIAKLGRELGDCQSKHAACEGRVAALEGKVALLEKQLAWHAEGKD